MEHHTSRKMRFTRSCFGNSRPAGQLWWDGRYLLDWGLGISLAVLSFVLTTYAISPYNRDTVVQVVDGTPVLDPTLDYPKHSDTVPDYALYLIAILFPAVVFVCAQYWSRSWHDLHHAALTLCESLTLTVFGKQFMNVAAGRYRPDWYARVATGNDTTIKDGRMSYPSGHAAFSFASMGVLFFYFAGRLKVFKGNQGQLWRAVLAASPLVLAEWIAISRTNDNRHNFSDINAGAVLGFVCATIAYHLQYEPLTSDRTGQPRFRVRDTQSEFEGTSF